MSKHYYIDNGQITAKNVVFSDIDQHWEDPDYIFSSVKLEKGSPIYDIFLDKTFQLTKGSEIYVAPNCPLASADIRKNYVIKRNPDSGVCNVLSGYSMHSQWVMIAYLPNGDEMIFRERYHLKESDYRDKVRSVPGYANLRDFEIEIKNTRIYLGKVPIVYIKLLDGTLTKPSILYTKLDTNYGLELTDDVVELVYQAGIQQEDTEQNEKNCELEINSLAQYNYRDYQRTMYFLTTFLKSNGRSMYRTMYRRASKYGKNVKLVLSTQFSESACSQKDYEMAKRFMLKRMGLEDGVKYCLFGDITKKANSVGIPTWLFCKMFETTVRVKPLDYESVNNTV